MAHHVPGRGAAGLGLSGPFPAAAWRGTDPRCVSGAQDLAPERDGLGRLDRGAQSSGEYGEGLKVPFSAIHGAASCPCGSAHDVGNDVDANCVQGTATLLRHASARIRRTRGKADRLGSVLRSRGDAGQTAEATTPSARRKQAWLRASRPASRPGQLQRFGTEMA